MVNGAYSQNLLGTLVLTLNPPNKVSPALFARIRKGTIIITINTIILKIIADSRVLRKE
jgi:hypothetical protein